LRARPPRIKRKATCGASEAASPYSRALRPFTGIPGLTARLDKLVHHHGGVSLPEDKPHAFVYYITIRNGSDRTVTLLGRKWVIEYGDGSSQVIEGDKIVGETPRLAPGRSFPTTATTHGMRRPGPGLLPRRRRVRRQRCTC